MLLIWVYNPWACIEKFYHVILLDERWFELLLGFSPHCRMLVAIDFILCYCKIITFHLGFCDAWLTSGAPHWGRNWRACCGVFGSWEQGIIVALTKQVFYLVPFAVFSLFSFQLLGSRSPRITWEGETRTGGKWCKGRAGWVSSWGWS